MTRFSVGAMNFGGRTAELQARRIVERALARGVADFDTANAYNDGESERILGRALKDVPGACVASKVGAHRVAGKAEGLRPERVLAAARASRERLQRPSIDLYYLHAPDPATPVDETLSAIEALLDDGTINTFGVSNYASWQILEIIHLCRARDMPGPADSQVLYNALLRQLEIEYFAFAARYQIHTTVFNPLAGGLLSGRYLVDKTPPKGSRLDGNRLYRGRYGSQKMSDFTAALMEIAVAEDLSLVELAYLWLWQRPGVDTVLLGPATVEHLDAALDAAARADTRPLSDAARKKIADVQLTFDGSDARYAR